MNQTLSGILLINKPKGPTSHQIVHKIRTFFNIKKVGHTGTLDPIASGLLIILIGKTTKKFAQFLNFKKTYLLEIEFGKKTETGDSEGKIIESIKQIPNISQDLLNKKLQSFIGKFSQKIPIFSAKKINGQKLCDLARKNKSPNKVFKKPVEIYSIKIIKYFWPKVLLKISCASGTFMRQLAIDIGDNLNIPSYAKNITRLSIGKFKLAQSVTLNQLIKEKLIKKFIIKDTSF